MMYLNLKLIKEQNLKQNDIDKIMKLHREKDILFLKIKQWIEDGNRYDILRSARKIEKLEFKMQKAWKFEQNYTRHIHWVFNPACSCPKKNNGDIINYQIIYSSKCMLHKRFVKRNHSYAVIEVSSISQERRTRGLNG